MPEPEETGPYARCKVCELDLETPELASAHREETLEAARAAAPAGTTYISGHATTILNPTPEEREQRRLDNIVSAPIAQATDEFCEAMDREVSAGRITEEQVTEQLRSLPDFGDAWAEWLANA